MNSVWKRITAGLNRACRMLPIAAMATTPAFAADDSPWSVSITPYVWVAGISGTVTGPIPNAPPLEASADFGDVLTKLNKIPVMLAGEVRYGDFGITADIMAISVKSSVKTDGRLYSGGNVKVGQIIGSALGTYRAVETDAHMLDVGIGFRAFSLSTDFTLDGALFPSLSFEPDMNWVNAIVGARYRYRFTPEWSVSLYGDIGGGSDDDLTWQAFGTVDYQLSQSTTVRAGYRHLSFRHDERVLRQDIDLSGPIIGATMRF